MEQKSSKSIEEHLIEIQPETFFECENEPIHNCHVHISIPAKGLQLQAILEAEKLLRKAGVFFDTGYGNGCRDWEFDWSLRGAFVEKERELTLNEQEANRIYRCLHSSKAPRYIPSKVLTDEYGQHFIIIFGKEEDFKSLVELQLLSLNVKPIYTKDNHTEKEFSPSLIGYRWHEKIIKITYSQNEEGY